jgi:ankyrin repeat protein
MAASCGLKRIGVIMKKRRLPFFIGIIALIVVSAFSFECNESNSKHSKKLQSDNKPFVYETLWKAAELGDLEDVKRHLARGENVNEIDPTNLYFGTPLLRALGYTRPRDNVSIEKHMEVIKCLIENGADVNLCSDTNVHYPLSVASGISYNLVRCLVENGANVRVKNNEGWTPLHDATAEGQLEIVKYLISKGSEINLKTNDGTTPLHNAAFFGNFDIVKYLVDNGADINATNQKEETPLDNAFDPIPIPGFLFKKKNSPIRDYSGIVKFLKEHGGKLSAKYLLFEASAEGNLDIVKNLIENGISIDVKNNTEQTPLCVAVNIGNYSVVKYLIDKGANVNVVDNNNHTPLFYATLLKPIASPTQNKNSRKEILNFLKANGAEFREGEVNEWNEQQRIKESR